MGQLSLKVRYQKNSDLAFSPDEIKSRYFLGIPITDPDGNSMSDDDIRYFIEVAQREMENYLAIKISKQVYEEQRDFRQDDWKKWGHIDTTFPVRKPITLQGFLNTTLQIDYPTEWLSSKQASDEKFNRTINLVPIHGAANSLSNNVIYAGIAPMVGYFGNSQIPNYWKVVYLSGFDKVPADILDAIGKLAAINIFHQLGDLIAGAGIASKSIGVDGLSQSISTTSSATNAGYGARIIGYTKDLERVLPRMSQVYKGLTFTVV